MTKANLHETLPSYALKMALLKETATSDQPWTAENLGHHTINILERLVTEGCQGEFSSFFIRQNPVFSGVLYQYPNEAYRILRHLNKENNTYIRNALLHIILWNILIATQLCGMCVFDRIHNLTYLFHDEWAEHSWALYSIHHPDDRSRVDYSFASYLSFYLTLLGILGSLGLHLKNRFYRDIFESYITLFMLSFVQVETMYSIYSLTGLNSKQIDARCNFVLNANHKGAIHFFVLIILVREQVNIYHIIRHDILPNIVNHSVNFMRSTYITYMVRHLCALCSRQSNPGYKIYYLVSAAVAILMVWVYDHSYALVHYFIDEALGRHPRR